MTWKSMFPKFFFAQVAGAATMGTIEAFTEWYSPELFRQPHRESGLNPPLIAEPLLPVEKWMTLIPISVVGFAISRGVGEKTKHRNIAAFGEGMLLYGMPRFVSREIVRTEQASRRNWKPPT